MPADVIVPNVAFPPDRLLTLQLTVVSVVFVTVAVKGVWLPSNTDPFAGVTVTAIDGGGGGGGGSAPAEPQPSVHAPSAKNATTRIVLVLNLSLLCERDRMPTGEQASCQRRSEGMAFRDSGLSKPRRPEETALNQHLGEFQDARVACACHVLNLMQVMHLGSVSFWFGTERVQSCFKSEPRLA